MRPKAVIILEALLSGLSVKWPVDGGEFVLAEEANGSLDLCQIGRTESGEEVYLRSHITLGKFLEISEKLPESDVFILSANIVLNKVKR